MYFSVWAADYTNGLTGKEADKNFLQSGILEIQGNNVNYNFKGNNSFTVEDDYAADLAREKNITINSDGLLTFNATSGDFNSARAGGLVITDGTNLTVNSDLAFNVHAGNWNAVGLGISRDGGGTGEGNETHMTINGDVVMRSDDPENPWGLTAGNIHGGYGPNGTAPGADNYTGARWAPAGISLANINGSTITINGDVDLAVKGTGVKTDPYYKGTTSSQYDTATINLNGGNIKIETPESDSETYYALANYGGTINVNMQGENQAGNHDVNIKGNIIVMRDDNDPRNTMFFRDGRINLALTTDKSLWTGVVDNSGKSQAGELNLYLQNGAVWNHKSLSKTDGLQVGNMPSPSNDMYGKYNGISYVENLNGGSDIEHAGYILQNDKADINVKKYSGNTVVVYKHQNSGTNADDYQAGNFKIENAAKNSGIVLSTDNTNIDLQDNQQVNKVLDTLAGKIYYGAYTKGENNLTGKVQIADGLTSSSISKVVGNIKFDGHTGQGSLNGSVTPPEPDEQTKIEFSTGINDQSSTEYKEGGVLQKDGSYKFSKDSTIKVNGNSAIDTSSSKNIKADTVKLNIISEGSNSAGMKAINVASGGNLKINSKEMNIVVNNQDGLAEGIYAGSENDKKSEAAIDGNIKISGEGTGKGDFIGVHAHGNSDITINGDLSINSNEKKDGITPRYKYYKNAGIYASGNQKTQQGSIITVNGNADIQGNGVFANSNGSEINLNGSGNITVDKQAENGAFAVGAQSGTVNINMNKDKTSADDNKFVINGNVALTNGGVIAEEKHKESVVNIGLSTKESVLNGVVINNVADNEDGFVGKANIYLSDGATWNNELYGDLPYGWQYKGSTVEKLAGGKDAENAGNIFQKDSKKLTVNNYSGNTNIYYSHENSGTEEGDYKAGDTVIKHAEVNSKVNLITDNKGITITDTEQVNKALNALAGKLVYEGYVSGERNLEGKVMIADGLTSSSASLAAGEIEFDNETGKGSSDGIKAEIPEQQIKVDFKTSITGNKEEDQEYVTGGVLKENGNYVFEKNSNITIEENKQSAINVEKDVVIKADGSKLNLKVTGNDYNVSSGISKNGRENEVKTEITAKEVNIDVTNKGRVEGIHMTGSANNPKNEMAINGNVNINAKSNKTYTLGAYVQGNSELTINGNVTMKGEDGSWGVDNGMQDKKSGFAHYEISGLYAGSNLAPGSGAKGGKINVNGKVDLAVNGTGVLANGGGSTINLNQGGTILINKDNVNEHYAIAAESATVNMNIEKGKDGNVGGKNDVNIKGNVGVLNGALHKNEPVKDSIVNIGLTTKDSEWTGVIVNNYTEQQLKEGKAEVNLYMNNGAVWNNEAYGTTKESFKGSTVENFVGGKDIEHAGYIFQKDSNKLTLNNYSGAAIVVYEHENKGSEVTDYKAGNTVVKKADKGSVIRLSTDNSNIDMNSSEEVQAALKALAQKLEYKEAQLKGDKLKAEVSIADGLTSSKVSQVGDIKFDENGNASYVQDSVHKEENGGVTIGDYETDIMKGARSAMMTSMLAWRENAAEVYNRGSEIRQGAEEGAWARSYGGKMKYSGSNVDLDNSYWAAQVGYDRTLENGWVVGAAIDYMDGNAKYLNGGEGKNKLYSVGVYGSKDLGDNQYLDISAKAGRVENEYKVYNIIGQELKGDYAARGYSVSAQYSKRIGEAEKGYIEPQMQLTWAHVDGKDYNTYSGDQVMNIGQEAFDSLVGRIGLKAGVENERGEVYAKLSLAHEFAGDVEGRYSATEVKHTKYDLGDTWSELTLGGSYNLSKCSNFYADVTRSLSGDYQHQWKVNAGINFTF